MQVLSIRGRTVQLDIAEYMQSEFLDEFSDAKWTSEKLIARSPFRADSHPSFYLNLDNNYSGFWGDSGENLHGFLPELVGLLKGISTEEAEFELLEQFEPRQGENLQIHVRADLKLPRPVTGTDRPNLSEYLLSRHVTGETQEAYKVSQYGKVVNFPYIDGSGVTRAVKHRSVTAKSFWYDDGGELITNLLFGAELIFKLKPSTIMICEAEIDAMTWHSHAGHVSVSLGNAGVSQKQAELLRKSGVQNVILGCDNDKVGKEANYKLQYFMGSTVNYFKPVYGAYKDINEYYSATGSLPKLARVSNDLIKL